MAASTQDQDSVTVTVTISSSKPQVTVPIAARRSLGIDGKRALLETGIRALKVYDDKKGREGDVTTTVTMIPPKSQITIPIEVRQALNIDGKRAELELTIRVVKVFDDAEENRGGS